MRYYGDSNKGLKRWNNQDSFTVLENQHHALLGVVCDGIGGGNAGDIASSMTIEHLQQQFQKADYFVDDQQARAWLSTVIQEANDLVFTQATKKIEQKGMGTTIVGVLKQEERTYIFNAGDSRTYGLYGDEFLCLTEDHSYVADLLKRGAVSAEEAAVHPKRNMLINALGIWNTMRIDIYRIKDDFQALLICSDGLHGYVKEDVICSILKSDAVIQAKVAQLIELSLEAGGYDNVTVVILEREADDHA